jgi:hypothetical protein
LRSKAAKIHKFHRLLVCCLILLAPLYAGEPEAGSLTYIDSLIGAGRYSQAIRALTAYMRDNPDDFDRAQERIRRIIGVQGGYNRLMGELLDIITEDPGDLDRILALARQLDAMETPDGSQTGEFVARIYNLARFAVNRGRLERILEGGRALTAAGDHAGALLVYEEGLDIYQEEFFTRGYGEELEDRVREHIARLEDAIARFGAVFAALRGELGGGRHGEPGAGTALFGRVEPALSGLIEIRAGIDKTGRYFLEQLARIQREDAALGDRSFLSFASRLIYGQNGDGTWNGILHGVDSLWAGGIGALDALASAPAAAAYERALADARNGNHRDAAAGFGEAAAYYALDRDIQELNGRYAREGRRDPPAGGGFRAARDFAVLRSRDAELLELSLNHLAAELAEIPVGTGGAEDVERIRGIFSGLIAEADEKIAELDRAAEEFRPGRPRAEVPGSTYTAAAAELLGKFRSRCLNTELSWAYGRYAALNADLERRLETRRAELREGNRLLEGLVPEDGALPTFYPREALARFNLTLSRVEEDLPRGRELLAAYGAERREVLTDGGIGALRAAAGALVAALEDLRRLGGKAARIASEQTARADKFRAQGDRYYREAGAALKQDEIAAARELIRLAAECYNESLSLEESAALRREWDTRMLALGQEIGLRENEIVIREVRELVNLARGEYFAENLENAEKLLMRGRNRWYVTNVEENPEITYWLSIVRGGLALRSGRVIPVTAPLFTEMGQLLSEARGDFERGRALIRARRVSEGLALFDGARVKTRKVKIVFPMNREAGILELMMDQVTDPQAFNASFQRRLNEALDGVSRRSAADFAELQNLAELNPGYPGIDDILERADILMGYRIAPPDPRILRRSDDLTRTARAIVDSNDREQFEAALRQLNEALSLNPNNHDAMALKDRVQTRMGTGNAVLSSADEGEYQRAVRELQRGNTLTAMSLVERLLLNPRNRNSTRIIELRRRIEAIL